MKFIPNEIRIMFSRFLALLGFLIIILKTLILICESLFIKSKGVFWWKIVKTSKAVTRKFWEKFSFVSFDQSRIPFNWSNVFFDWSKRNREPIDSGRNTMMKFFIVSIDWEFLSIDRILFSIDRTGIENQSNKAVALWWISSFFDRSRKKFDQLKALNFEFSLTF